MSLVTPRILPEYLQQFYSSGPTSGRMPSAVRILGRVSSLRGEYATITCGDHGDITLILNRDSHLQMDRMVDVVGKVVEVEGNLGLRVFGATDCGSPHEVDYKIYEQVVESTHRFKTIFYDSG
ncbi:hypothetical protein MGYG_07640 [Nannizzia gypsea CBS 118893]|uniref:SsDNA binding protein Ssb3 n=1 Tax=Arthroderma gypseum (strain ATCC MYA-4604 / CBS 118893) TaxID=535722 RepID=E4V3Q9_ARTGP|nr:hypothetical protein MGYG_07640 [Nannizzia gypsea CBS 118893]EFR04633.1 hypothetical protein MGYG_07640 [Nannizzia gypsea CBS 118893]